MHCCRQIFTPEPWEHIRVVEAPAAKQCFVRAFATAHFARLALRVGTVDVSYRHFLLELKIMNLQKLVRAIFFDILLIICLYLWIECGYEHAREIAIAYLCIVAEITWIAALLVRARDYEHGYPVNAFYDFVSTMAIIGILVWERESYIALFLGIPYFLTLVKREVAQAW